VRVRNHRLTNDAEEPYSFVASPNIYHNADGTETELFPRLLVVHFTAGVSSLGWLTSPLSKASAHLLITRCGQIIQMVPFNRCAWHAGSKSVWKGRVNCNLFSIGFEMENLGKMHRDAGGKWVSWQGVPAPDSEVVEAVHKNEHEMAGWHKYTPDQIDAVTQAAKAVVAAYGLEIVGHEDVLPEVKVDPGPAFDMEALRKAVAW